MQRHTVIRTTHNMIASRRARSWLMLLAMGLCLHSLTACTNAVAPQTYLEFERINYTSPQVTGGAPRDYTRSIIQSHNF